MTGQDVEGHLNGSEFPPTLPTPLRAGPTCLTPAEKEKVKAYHVAHKKWKHDKNVTQV